MGAKAVVPVVKRRVRADVNVRILEIVVYLPSKKSCGAMIWLSIGPIKNADRLSKRGAIGLLPIGMADDEIIRGDKRMVHEKSRARWRRSKLRYVADGGNKK